MLDALWIDVRHATRRLRRSPGMSFAIVATLALVIGANTTVFSLVNAILLRPVVASDPDRLVGISTTDTRTNQAGYIYLDTFTAFRDQQRSFSVLSMYSVRFLRVEGQATATDVNVECVLPDYLALMGTQLAVGRFLTDRDNDPAAPAAIITDRLWQRMFGGDVQAVGETMKVDGKPVTLVGVTAPGFSGLQFDGGTDVFLPLSFLRTLGGDNKGPLRAANVIGRLAPGITLKEARAEVVARWPALHAATAGSLSPADPKAAQSQQVAMESLATGFSTLRREYGQSLVVLIGLSAILLAIACANVTGMMLARALARQHEVAVLLALGAGRPRVFQQSVLEGLLLALCSLAFALPLAWWSSQLLSAMLTVARATPLVRPLTPDGKVVAVAAVIAIIMGLAIGLIPAWRALNGRAGDAIRGGRTIARTLSRSGRLVLVTQVALSMVLLVGASLFVGMLSSLHANDAQFRARNVVWTRLARNPGDRATLSPPYFQGLFEQLSGIPGVHSAALSTYFPAYLGFRGSLPSDRFTSDGADDASPVTGLSEFVSPGFFDTVGIARLHGRDFTWRDDGSAPAVVIVNETLAEKLSPDGNTLGTRMRVTSGSTSTDLEIVAVVADAPIGSIREPHLAVAFRPMMQELTRAQFPMAHVRVSGDAKSVRDAYVRAVGSQSHHFVRALFTLDEWIDFALLQERLIAGVATSAAALAVLLACLGIYGLLAYTVTSRVREIGVRVSLGATRAAVLKMVVRQGVTVAVLGVLIGIPCALGAARLVRSQLYGVTPADPRTIIGSAVLFMVVAVAAALVPALRASKIDPMVALRQE